MGAYDKDFYAWAMEQAALLREGRLAEIDLEHVAEEIESLGRGTKSELINRLAILLAHLLKWQFQPSLRGTSWSITIEDQRDEIRSHLADNPSLRATLPDSFERAYRKALRKAMRETGFGRQDLPPTLPWTQDQVLDDSFLPE
ncbi:MAG TPA: DUF29 domain-containing protein [Acetobacteraceae bacterium]|nr:DUF29 domain-containing protein [Acetobacteraceae bacterium]